MNSILTKSPDLKWMKIMSVNINEFTYNQSLNVIGGGLNYKLGLILARSIPSNWVAYHSKTRFEIEENWESNLTTIFTEENIGMISDMSPYGFGNYTLKTPKTISSIALIKKED